MSRMKVSVIGTGHAGRSFHIPGLSVFPDVDLSICDIDQTLLNAVGDEFRIPPARRYAEYREMLERENPEAVLLLMAQYPHGNHSPDTYFRILNELMDQGRHVLVEKPLAMTPDEARPLVEKAEKTGVITMVSVNRRFNPLVTLCRKAVEHNGPVLNVSCHYYKAGPPVAAGSLDRLTSDMMHALDLMRFLLGEDVAEARTTVARTADDGMPTAFFALATSRAGATGVFSANVRAGERLQMWEIHGINISAVIQTEAAYPMASPSMSAVIYRPDERPARYLDTEIPTGRPYLDMRDAHVSKGFAHADRYFINCVRARRQPHCNFADSYRTLCLCRDILQGDIRVIQPHQGSTQVL